MMNDRGFYITLGLIAAAILGDILFRGGAELLFLARKILDLMDYLIFWR